MERSLTFFRRAARWLGPALALLLVGVVVMGSAHHHGALDGDHACAVCTAAHAPAISSGAAPTLATPAATTRYEHSPNLEPRVRPAVRGIASRAPPSA